MSIRLLLWLSACCACWLAAGCDRPTEGALTAEIDEPAYRRGKELLRQGRNQEALAAFLRVIEQRSDAAESHLEVGLLYQQQIRDPIAAIYHYRKFTELKPNSPQADLVRQRIAAATREFARTLPAQPLENQVMRNDLLEVVEHLKRENNELKDQLAMMRVNAALPSAAFTPAVADLAMRGQQPAPPASRASAEDSALASRGAAPAGEPRVLREPTRPAAADSAAASSARRHVVEKGDTLYNLAQRYYSNQSRWRDIYAANRAQMTSENDLKIGMQLVIP